MNIQNLIDTSVTVSSDWLKENLPTTYDGIMIRAEEYADDDTNTFTHDELNEWKEQGFFCHIGLYEGMKKGSFETHTTPYGLNDSPAHDPWFVDHLDGYSNSERETLLAKLGE